MGNQINNNYRLFCLIGIALLLSGCIAQSTPASVTYIPPGVTPTGVLTASLSEIIGSVLTQQASQADFSQASDGARIQSRAQVKTLEDSRVRLDLYDGSIVRLGPRTLFTLEGQQSEKSLNRLRLDMGTLWLILSTGAAEVLTPFGIASVRGSYLSVSIDPGTEAVFITCLEGECSLENDAGSIDLVSGETGLVSSASAPPIQGRMQEEDVEEWLRVNPEATSVLIPLTETVEKLPSVTSTAQKIVTSTPKPSATETPLPTPTPSLTVSKTSSPTENITPTLEPTRETLTPTGTTPPAGTRTPILERTRTRMPLPTRTRRVR